MKCTEALAEMLSEIKLEKEDVLCIRKLLLDFFAASYAGYSINRPFNRQVESVVLPQGGAAESTVFLNATKLPAPKAAFLNALYAHGAELDDGNRKAAGHIGVHVFPSVFALAEKLGSTEQDVLMAIATGYEAYIRISTAAQPGMVKRGYHSTGMAGTLGSAAACASLYHLDAKGIENAIALATTMTGGLLSYGDSRPVIKPLNPAKAAESGVFAAMLAATGMEGPTEALEGPNGWFHAVTDTYDAEQLVRQPGERLLIHACYFKLYPSCRHTHCGLEAGIALHGSMATADMEKIKVYIYPNAIKLAGLRNPKTADETKFSIPYTLACGLANGGYGVADLQRVGEMPAAVRELMEKIEMIPDPSMENREKGIRGARVELIAKDGTRKEETVLIPKGDPEKPLSFADIEEKLKACVADLSEEKTEKELVRYVSAFGNGTQFRYPKL